MSPRSTEQSPRRFLTDRMLGTLTRYLRFMGYDTMSANSLSPGNTREDTLLLDIASKDDRILLTGTANSHAGAVRRRSTSYPKMSWSRSGRLPASGSSSPGSG